MDSFCDKGKKEIGGQDDGDADFSTREVIGGIKERRSSEVIE